MSADVSGTIRCRIKNLLRSPSIKLRRSGTARRKHDVSGKVTLEKVMGITSSGNRALACDPRTGLLAYPAGCVVVLLNPLKNKQHHIFNSSRKAITTLAFSPDGKYIVTGECGHMPAVRVWEASERLQVSELQEHKYGVSCVTFSPNGKYIVSVGYQHDMMVNVWNWKKNVVVAANKVSSKVTAVSFSDDSSYFVTAGNRHIKFWYLDHTKTSKVNATVPLLGRSGLLGELRNNFFSDVACGRGRRSSSTFCITSSGLLCEFNDRRLLDKWVELRRISSALTAQATCLSVTEEFIFCGCSDGTVRAFSPVNLHFLCTLPRPHSLGTDIATMVNASQLFSCRAESHYPDSVAVTYDPNNHWLSCVYNDHSLYVWDVQDLRRAGKLYSALYHSSCVWGLEVFTEGGGGGDVRLPPGSFLSCSSDNTIRLWSIDRNDVLHRNILSNDLQKVIYVDNNVASLLDADSITVTSSNTEKTGLSGSEGQQMEQNRVGIRTLRVSPDGKHLASGDRVGVLRIHDLGSMEEILNVQAHDSEILCLEFSKPDTGLQLLATASRDRLIHILDVGREYSLVQTLDEHSSSITAIRFAANEGKVRMISCGADKSIYFRTAQEMEEGLEFTRTHHVVRKATLYDMDIEPSRNYAAVGCQDRKIRIFNISNGKQKKIYKGSLGEDGTVIKVQIDPSGLYIATSCSDKNISIFDFFSGECVATMFGHSEIVTGLKFSSDCRHLITVSGDSCIFVWRLNPELTIRMRERLADLQPCGHIPNSQNTPQQKAVKPSRETHPRVVTLSSDSDAEEEEGGGANGSPDEEAVSDEMSNRESKTESSEDRLPRRRWSRRTTSTDDVLMVKSMLDLRLLDSYGLDGQEEPEELKMWAHSGNTCSLKRRRRSQGVKPGVHGTNEKLGSTVSIQVSSAWTGDEAKTNERPGFIQLSNQSLNRNDLVLFPEKWEDRISLTGSEFQVKEACPSGGDGQQDKPSPDSGVSVEFSSPLSSPDTPAGDESTGPLSVEMEQEDEEEEGGKVTQVVPLTPDQEAFLKENFDTLADQSASGSPNRTSHSSSESLSISSRFLFKASGGSRSGWTSEGRVGGVKAQALVSEVRPLMDGNQSWTQNQDQTFPHQDQSQTQSHFHHDQSKTPLLQNQRQHDLNQFQVQLEGKETSSCHQPPSHLSLKKIVQTAVDPRRNPDLVVRSASSHLNAGLQKAQSVHSLLDVSVGVPSDTFHPTREAPPPRPTTLPSSPRWPPSSAPPTSRQSPTSPQSSQQDGVAITPRKSSSSSLTALALRSYMSPTASSMAKMSRSVSMGDGLHIPEPAEDPVPPSALGSCTQVKETPPPPVAVVHSNVSQVPPHVAVVPVVISSSSSMGNRSAPPRSLQARVPSSSSRPLPDKPSLDSFSPSSKSSGLMSPTASVSSVAPSQQGEEPLTPAGFSTDPTEDPDQPISLESCRALTNELQSCFRRATRLYRQADCINSLEGFCDLASQARSSAEKPLHCCDSPDVQLSAVIVVSSSSMSDSSPNHCQMAILLSDAFQAMRSELDSLPLNAPSMLGVQGGLGGVGEVKTAALLEEYSLLLLQAVHRRINNTS
nr:mitogen-activated protein kinase-binding protein 1 isoform X3 [Nothobranchius furzeri]